MANEFISIGNMLFKKEVINTIELKGNSITLMSDKGHLGEVKFESNQDATEEMNKVKHKLEKE